MSQIQNLLDLFSNGRKDAQAKGTKLTDAKAQNPGVKASDLLPVDAGGKSGGAPKSFQSKIKESHAKLAAKAAGSNPRNRTADAKASGNDGRDNARDNGSIRQDADRKTQSDRHRAGSRTDRIHTQARQPAAGADRNDQPGKPDWNMDVTHPAQAQARQSDAGAKADGQTPALDAEAVKELQDGLQKLGIKVSDQQLQDPAFLNQLLQMLKSMPEPETETATAGDLSNLAQATTAPAPAEDGIGAAATDQSAPTDGTVQADDGGSQAVKTPAAQIESKPGDKQAVADLIQKHLDALAANPAAPGGKDGNPAIAGNAPTTTPAGWQGIKVRPQVESITTQPLPMADLDRMRVLQASALQAGNAGKAIEPGSVKAGDEMAPVGSIREAGNSLLVSEGKNDSGEPDNGGTPGNEADLFGGNGDASGKAEAAAPKDGSAAAKEGATGNPFQNSLEQARSVDHHAGIQRAWEPRPAFEPSALDQIAKRMSAAGHKNGDEINIQLSPEHLGKVNVSLEMKEGAMTARISVESDSVRQQVEAGISSLKEALENQGIKLQGLEVSVDQKHGSLFNPDGSNAESFFQRNGRGEQGGAQGAAEVTPFESVPESDTGRRWGYNTMEYIG